MTKEEQSRMVMAYQKKYYAEHPDKLARGVKRTGLPRKPAGSGEKPKSWR